MKLVDLRDKQKTGIQIKYAWQQNWNRFNVYYFSKIFNIQINKNSKYKVEQRNDFKNIIHIFIDQGKTSWTLEGKT
jgi:hypothetical protein